MTYKEYLRCKNVSESELTKEQAFKAGQCTIVALLADYLNMSLTWENYETAIQRMFAKVEK